MKVEKLTTDEKEEQKAEGELPKKSVRKKEDRQLMWLVVIVGLVFASILIPYFYIQNSKSFEFARANWTIEDYENLRVFHGRFKSLAGANLIYNIYLRGDPRENLVETSGTFDKFKYGGFVSMSPEVDECRGEIGRAMFDLGAFLRQGVGVEDVKSGSTDKSVALESNRRHAVCNTVQDRTLVIVELGEPKVVQNEDYPYCYTIYMNDCDDTTSIEKFMIKTMDDFGARRDEAIETQEVQ